MEPDYLTLDIKYNVRKNEFDISGDVNDEGQRELVEAFLMGQIGSGPDYTKPEIRDTYNIILKWHPVDDRIEVESDTGNKGLRAGILLDFLRRFDKLIQ